MIENPTREAMQSGLYEIRALRRENEILRAKVEMIDLFAAVLFAQPRGGVMGAGHPDPAHLLERALADMSAEKKPA